MTEEPSLLRAYWSERPVRILAGLFVGGAAALASIFYWDIGGFWAKADFICFVALFVWLFWNE